MLKRSTAAAASKQSSLETWEQALTESGETFTQTDFAAADGNNIAVTACCCHPVHDGVAVP